MARDSPDPLDQDALIFNADTPGTVTDGFQEALEEANRSGLSARVHPGHYAIRVPVHLPSGVTIDLDDPSFTVAGPMPIFTGTGIKDVTLRGRFSWDSREQPTPGISLDHVRGLTLDIEGAVKGVPVGRTWLRLLSSSAIRIEGHLQSQDSKLLTLMSCNDVEISGVEVHLTRDLGAAPISLTGLPGESFQNAFLHDLLIDGGGCCLGPGLVVRVDAGVPEARNIRIERIFVHDTRGPGDGIDLQRVASSSVSRCYFLRTGDGLSLVGHQIRAEGIWSEDTRAEGVAVGDGSPSYMSEDTYDILVRRCLSVGCGTSGFPQDQVFHRAGFTVLAPTPRRAHHILFEESASIPKGVTRLGIGMMGNLSDVRFREGLLAGLTAPSGGPVAAPSLTLEEMAPLAPGGGLPIREVKVCGDELLENSLSRDIVVWTLCSRSGTIPGEATVSAWVGGQSRLEMKERLSIPARVPAQITVPFSVRIPTGGIYEFRTEGVNLLGGWEVTL